MTEEVETLPNYDIKWNGMTLPINSELWDEWTLSKKIFYGPELLVPVRITYVPDERFDFVHRDNMEDDKPSRWRFWKFPKYWWQYYKTRAISYRGRIYIKESAHRNRALLLHELGHTVTWLEHTHTLRPGIMNPMSKMWLVKKEHLR
jgi:hypothetical protein